MQYELYNIINNEPLCSINIGKLNRKQVLYAVYSKADKDLNKLVEDGLVGIRSGDSEVRGQLIDLAEEEGFVEGHGHDKRRYVRIGVNQTCGMFIGGTIKREVKIGLREMAYGSFVFESTVDIPEGTDVVLKVVTTSLNCWDAKVKTAEKLNKRVTRYMALINRDPRVDNPDSMDNRALYSYIMNLVTHEYK